MQMRPRGTSRGAHGADTLAHCNSLASHHRNALKVRVARLEPTAVIDLDRIAVTGTHAREGDFSGRRRVDRGQEAAGEVQPGMERRASRYGIEAGAEARAAAGAGHGGGERHLVGGVGQSVEVTHGHGGVLHPLGERLIDVEHGCQRLRILAFDQRTALAFAVPGQGGRVQAGQAQGQAQPVGAAPGEGFGLGDQAILVDPDEPDPVHGGIGRGRFQRRNGPGGPRGAPQRRQEQSQGAVPLFH